METSICLIGIGIVIIFGSLIFYDLLGVLLGIAAFGAGIVTLRND